MIKSPNFYGMGSIKSSPKQTVCHLHFRVSADTEIGQRIKIVGEGPQLGNWDPDQGIELKTSSEDYPVWKNINALTIPWSKLTFWSLFGFLLF